MAEPPVVAEEDEVLLGRGKEVHVGPPVLAVRVEQVVPAGNERKKAMRCEVTSSHGGRQVVDERSGKEVVGAVAQATNERTTTA